MTLRHSGDASTYAQHGERQSNKGRNPAPLIQNKLKWTPACAGVTALAFAGMTIIAGCATPEPPKPPLVQTVAVLPFDNESNDINAPEIMQSYVYWALRGSPYQVSDIKSTNAVLAEKGVIDGGQLPVMDPVKIAKDLQVQALVYGYISDFGYINLGFYRSRKVGLNLKMVDGTTGQTLWENNGTVNNAKFAVDPKEAQKEFVKGVADQLADKVFKSPLEEEAQLSVQKALRTLPGFTFCGFQNTPVRANAAKNALRGRINQ